MNLGSYRVYFRSFYQKNRIRIFYNGCHDFQFFEILSCDHPYNIAASTYGCLINACHPLQSRGTEQGSGTLSHPRPQMLP